LGRGCDRWAAERRDDLLFKPVFQLDVEDRATKEQLDAAQLTGVIDFCRDHGVIVGRSDGGRGYGTTIAICPPLVITRADCDRIVDTLGRAPARLDLN
jgi:4-aminobutyrate aminotransferase-like enzyme